MTHPTDSDDVRAAQDAARIAEPDPQEVRRLFGAMDTCGDCGQSITEAHGPEGECPLDTPEPDQSRGRFTGDERDEKVHTVLMPSERCVWASANLPACDPDKPVYLACQYCREKWLVES